MSEIRATTISDSAGTGPITLTGQHAAKAWVNFDQSTGLVVKGSFNISSSTDYAGAKSYHNVTNSYSDIYFTTASQASSGQLNNSNFEAEAWSKDAGSFWVYVHWQTTAYDREWVCCTTFGDLA